ncbi:unnamed protein product, partial [Mesorhabditis belari]|uniref:Cep192/Spd-2-like domain-containing protein n=1 Tax=Mesorhabditis belari TaxID=2138241 RepID=A0AAF3F6Q3_9BILA
MSPLPKLQSHIPHHRVDALWDSNADKYRVACRSVHVTKGTLYIGYAQMAIITVFSLCLLFFYGQALHGNLPTEHWAAAAGSRYLTSLLTAVSLQMALVLMLLHGVRTEKRSFLLPFIVFACFALFVAFAQIFADVMAASQHRGGGSVYQLISHLIGMMVHVWCVAVVWRCYCYLGDKKVAEHIGAQLEATQPAFACEYSLPPPYADSVEKRGQRTTGQPDNGQDDEMYNEDFSQGDEMYNEDFSIGSEAEQRLRTYKDFSKENKSFQNDSGFNQLQENSWERTPNKFIIHEEKTLEEHAYGSKQDESMVSKIMSTPQTVVNGRRMDRHSLKRNLDQQFAGVPAIPCQRLDDDLPSPSYNDASMNTSMSEVEVLIYNMRQRVPRKKVDFREDITNRHSKTVTSMNHVEPQRRPIETRSATISRHIPREFDTGDASVPKRIRQETNDLNILHRKIVEDKPIVQTTKLSRDPSPASTCSTTTETSTTKHALNIKPSTLQFGFVEVNTAVTLRVTIRNTSKESIEIDPSLKRNTPEFKLSSAKRILHAGETYDLEVTFNPVGKDGRMGNRLVFYDSILIKISRPEPMIFKIPVHACAKVAQLSIFAGQTPLNMRKNGDFILKVANLEQFSLTLQATQRAAFAVIDVIDVLDNPLECQVNPSKRILLQKNQRQNVHVMVNDTIRATSSLSNSSSSINTCSNGPAFFVRIVWAELISLQRAIIYARKKSKTIVLEGSIGNIQEEFFGKATPYEAPIEWPISSCDVELLKRSLRSTKIFVSTDRIVAQTQSVFDLTINQTAQPWDLDQTFNSTFSRTIIPDPDATLTL